MAAASMLRRKEELFEENFFRRNALLIIDEMVELSKKGCPWLMDEVLHSIFFLGKINTPPLPPEQIVTDAKMFNKLERRYPEAFRYYHTKPPQRSPISCVLDMIVSLKGQEHEEAVIKRLQELILKLKKNDATELVSNTICVSQARPNSRRHYGVSMSTSGPLSRQIMIAASCLNNWDSYVAGAVMTYYPNKVKKTYFDGTFTLPQQVRCQAFSLTDRSPMDPCRSCGNLFGLTTRKTREWPYGNCAECESVSNLLKNEQGVREKVRPVSDAERQRAEKELLRELRNRLLMVKFTRNREYNPTFYNPQVSV